ncbi:geranylgeranyl pyrophosphate synthase [Spirochaetia bacterium]|nr:geranylgeranyl pyrophosphate synthase [Spirochaetia bacterium]
MTSYWQDFPGIPESLERVSGIIRETSASENPIISQGLSGLFDGQGKLLRPGLLLIAAGFGKVQDKHYTLAACLEMLHMATLIHDDVIDESPTRRGQPAVHAQYGNRNAVLMGDYLLSRCFLLASEYTSADNAVGLARVIATICGMEIEQNSDRFRTNISLRRYLRKIMGKSAALFALACHVGASEAKASRALTAQLRRIGYNIGMAFQIIDDILDYSGDPGTVRKPLGNDLKDGLVTLPLICALQQEGALRGKGAFAPEGAALRGFFSGDHFSAGNNGAIIGLVRNSGGLEAARAYAEKYTARAIREIAALPAGGSRDMLDRLTRRLLVREA